VISVNFKKNYTAYYLCSRQKSWIKSASFLEKKFKHSINQNCSTHFRLQISPSV